MNLKSDQFRLNSVGPQFCSALFFASTGSGFEQIVGKSTIPVFGLAGQQQFPALEKLSDKTHFRRIPRRLTKKLEKTV
jgi:hypothetical protein